MEALNPLTNAWQTLASLNHARHGTQAIVSGQGVYVTAGSPNQGGGNQRNMEVYSVDLPGGAASVAGVLSAAAAVTVTNKALRSIRFSHVAGNEGVFVNATHADGED